MDTAGFEPVSLGASQVCSRYTTDPYLTAHCTGFEPVIFPVTGERPLQTGPTMDKKQKNHSGLSLSGL